MPIFPDFHVLVPTIPDMLSSDETREAIAFHANNINRNVGSKLVNQSRIDSLRELLDLFERYNSSLD